MDGKINNIEQIVSAYELTFTNGKAKGKDVVLVHNGGLEVMFSKTNALDVIYVKFNGVNISLLTKNGINEKSAPFLNKFEAGFLYTCGLDNIGGCVENAPMHGSLHSIPADKVLVENLGDRVIVKGEILDSALFGKNLVLQRCYTVYSDRIEISDKLTNNAFCDDKFILLYHINYGYPFLDENLTLEMPSLINSVARVPFAPTDTKEQFKFTKPIDLEPERCFYNYLKEGKVILKNKAVSIGVEMTYDVNALPVTVEWKSMASGDYALGVEPATSIFEGYEFTPIKKGETKNFDISIKFSKI